MGIKTQDETTIRKYLLGQLPNEENQEVEMWLLSDDEALDLINAAEDDLIDEALDSHLRGDELQRFESHFLAAPQRRKKYQFSRTLHRRLHSNANAIAEKSEEPARESFWGVIRNYFYYQLPAGYAAATLIVILAIGGPYYQAKLNSTSSNLAVAQKQNNDSQAALADARAALQEQEAFNKGQGLTDSFNLISGPVTRNATTLQTVKVKSDSELIFLYLDLPEGQFEGYRAEMYVVGIKDPLQTWNSVPVVGTGTNRKARIFQLGMSLPSGELSFKLQGVSSSKTSETLSFRFQVLR